MAWMMQKWGEIPDSNNDGYIEKIDFNSLKTFENSNIDIPPLLYQPSFDAENILNEDCLNMDPRIIENINLMMYIRKYEDQLNDIEKQALALKSQPVISNVEKFLSMLSVLITAPPLEQTNNILDKLDYPSKLASIFDSDFHKGKLANNLKSINASLLSSDCRTQLMKRSLAIICTNTGFITSDQSCLDTLLGVLHQFMRTLTTQLKAAYDRNSSEPVFPDLIAKVLLELGQGSHIELVQSCQNQFVKSNKLLRDNAESIYRESLRQQESLKQSIPSLLTSPSMPIGHSQGQYMECSTNLNDDNHTDCDSSEKILTATFENQDNDSLLHPYKKFKNV